MSRGKEIGVKGEQFAVDYLSNIGYIILERNWRFGKAEVDIIALHQKTIVFVEVKTRSSDHFGKPEEFISKTKQNLMLRASAKYLENHNHTGELRFDVIAIIIHHEKKYTWQHFEDAFFY